MKQTPYEEKIEARMQAGVLTLSGFLGDDDRHYHLIIEEDEKALDALGYTAEQVAERLQYFTDLSWDSYETPIEVEGKYLVETEVVRGKLPCPFAHRGVYRKAFTILTHIPSSKTIRWSSLNLHLIKEHHFFEGHGSPFRLEPAELVEILF